MEKGTKKAGFKNYTQIREGMETLPYKYNKAIKMLHKAKFHYSKRHII